MPDEKKNDDNLTTTKPTTLVDLEERQVREAETPEEFKARTEKAFAESAAPQFGSEENNEGVENYVGINPEYANHAEVARQPFASEEGAEAEAEKRLLAAMAERDQNSMKAAGGATTYGPAVEQDPVGRTEAIVRGGTGHTAADRAEVLGEPRKAAPAPKPAADKPAKD